MEPAAKKFKGRALPKDIMRQLTDWLQAVIEPIPPVSAGSRVLYDSLEEKIAESFPATHRIFTRTLIGRELSKLFPDAMAAGRGQLKKDPVTKKRPHYYKHLSWKSSAPNTDFGEEMIDDGIRNSDSCRAVIVNSEHPVQSITATTCNTEVQTDIEREDTSKDIEIARLGSVIDDLKSKLAAEKREKERLYRLLASRQTRPEDINVVFDHRNAPSHKNTSTLHHIGEGGFGKVDACLMPGSGEKVAVKVLKQKKDFLEELRYLIAVQSEHIDSIQRLISFDVKDKVIVSNLVEYDDHTQSSLWHAVSDPEEYDLQTKDYIHQLRCFIHSVQHIHSLGILHNDLKTDNFVMKSRTAGVLIDFGVACSMLSPFTWSQVNSNQTWIAPEVREARSPVSIASDIYSIGVAFEDISSLVDDCRLRSAITACSEPEAFDRPGIGFLDEILCAILAS
ncbi:unnamed protein product [Owenia fusiformis]|uniref:Uncharacterized protein n=1 Tax=Owenia fusiformis TaxID=6347 RepID=A0A8J1XRD3_OWEFU|nr:unnamed protein product [Owenia fusiformis]